MLQFTPVVLKSETQYTLQTADKEVGSLEVATLHNSTRLRRSGNLTSWCYCAGRTEVCTF